MSQELKDKIAQLEKQIAALQSSLPDPALLREATDRMQIEKMLYRYARAIDRVDAELLKTVFWPDAVYDGGPYDGTFVTGLDEWLSHGLRNACAATQHYMINMNIDIEGDRAWSETYLLAYHRTYEGKDGVARFLGAERAAAQTQPDKPQDFMVGNRYLDSWEKRDGAWKIKTRRFVVDWCQVSGISDETTGGALAAFQYRGERSRSDQSYRRL